MYKNMRFNIFIKNSSVHKLSKKIKMKVYFNFKMKILCLLLLEINSHICKFKGNIEKGIRFLRCLPIFTNVSEQYNKF